MIILIVSAFAAENGSRVLHHSVFYIFFQFKSPELVTVVYYRGLYCYSKLNINMVVRGNEVVVSMPAIQTPHLMIY